MLSNSKACTLVYFIFPGKCKANYGYQGNLLPDDNRPVIKFEVNDVIDLLSKDDQYWWEVCGVYWSLCYLYVMCHYYSAVLEINYKILNTEQNEIIRYFSYLMVGVNNVLHHNSTSTVVTKVMKLII